MTQSVYSINGYISNGKFYIQSTSDLTFIYALKLNNQDAHKSKKIELNNNLGITDFIINNDTTIIKNESDKIILRKAPEDEYNIEYAFLYGYFLIHSGMSKNQASKLLKELRNIVNE